MSAWLTLPDDDAYVREVWTDAPATGLGELLAEAQEQLEAYAPALEDGQVVPRRYRRALVLQARENALASQRQSDVIGIGEVGMRARPLSNTVAALLRPERAVPAVG